MRALQQCCQRSRALSARKTTKKETSDNDAENHDELWNEITPEDYDEPDADWVPAKKELRIEGEIYTE